MKKILYVLATCAGLLTACEKGTLVETTEYEKLAPADPKYSYIKILNLTPGSPVVNYYMNGPKFSAGLSSSGLETAGFGYNGIFPDFGYAVVKPGTNKLTAKVVPRATVDPSLQVLDKEISTAAGKYFTVITGGVYDAVNLKTIPSATVFEDVKPALDTSKVFIRLINFYNNGPSFDVVKDSISGSKLFSSVAFGTASAFVEVPGTAGIGGTGASFRLFFKDVVTGLPIVPVGTNFTLTKGRAYTLYTRGAFGVTTFPFGLTFYTTFF